MIITLQAFEADVEYYLEKAKEGDITVIDNGTVLGYVTTRFLNDQDQSDIEKDKSAE